MRPLPDEIPFKLSERSEDMEDELATAGGGVDLLLQRAEANAPVLESPDGVDQMRQRAAQPVQPPDHQGVACSKVGERLGEAGAFRHGARHRIGVELLAAGSGQCVLLEGEGLVSG